MKMKDKNRTARTRRRYIFQRMETHRLYFKIVDGHYLKREGLGDRKMLDRPCLLYTSDAADDSIRV